jgi:hypothetical protein
LSMCAEPLKSRRPFWKNVRVKKRSDDYFQSAFRAPSRFYPASVQNAGALVVCGNFLKRKKHSFATSCLTPEFLGIP